LPENRIVGYLNLAIDEAPFKVGLAAFLVSAFTVRLGGDKRVGSIGECRPECLKAGASRRQGSSIARALNGAD